MIEWVKVLETRGFFNLFTDNINFAKLTDQQKRIYKEALPTVVKNESDLKRFEGKSENS